MKRIRTVAIIATLTVAFYAVIDWSYGKLFPLEPYSVHPERLQASAYLNEPYFSEAFLLESFIQQSGGLKTVAGTRIVLPHPYRGKYLSADVLEPTGLPYRRTVNSVPMGGNARLVLLLGGSTLHSLEVPDELTVASQLARMLNERGGEKFHVVNAGVFSASTIQENERLQLELDRGLRPDIVVSLNGVNDVCQGVYFGDPGDVMFSSAKRTGLKEWLKSVLPLGMLPLSIYRSFRS